MLSIIYILVLKLTFHGGRPRYAMEPGKVTLTCGMPYPEVPGVASRNRSNRACSCSTKNAIFARILHS